MILFLIVKGIKYVTFLPTLAYELNLGYHRQITHWGKHEHKFLSYGDSTNFLFGRGTLTSYRTTSSGRSVLSRAADTFQCLQR